MLQNQPRGLLMKEKLIMLLTVIGCVSLNANPIIWSDIPDMAMIRVDKNYYMSSTTMHLSPGLPIMKSTDLFNWSIVGYAYETLGDNEQLNLENNKNAYGAGSWASSLRYHDGVFYATTFSSTTGKTHIYRTKDIEKGPWVENSFAPALHDHSLFFDDDGRVYMIFGSNDIRLVEMKPDLSGLQGDMRVIVPNASRVAGDNVGLPAEGSQMFKVNGKYYLFNITWPRGGMRTVLIHRADKITGPYEGRVGLQDKGVAQGGLIDTCDGKWYAYLFQDSGAVGRIPYLVPVEWKDGWPVLASVTKGKSSNPVPGIVNSDEFSEETLPLVWQWNHNPVTNSYSLTKRPGFLRLINSRIDTSYTQARNTLTQRTYGPECSGTVKLDISGMKEGDIAGLSLLQKQYGLVCVTINEDKAHVKMFNAEKEVESVPLEQKTIYLKAECDFKNRADTARFFYSQDGEKWIPIGNALKMVYTLPHFMGYRFGLFSYATKSTGGYADFDYFHVSGQIGEKADE